MLAPASNRRPRFDRQVGESGGAACGVAVWIGHDVPMSLAPGRSSLPHAADDLAARVVVARAPLGDAPYAWDHDTLTIWLHDDLPEGLLVKYLSHATFSLLEESETRGGQRRRHLTAVPHHAAG